MKFSQDFGPAGNKRVFPEVHAAYIIKLSWLNAPIWHMEIHSIDNKTHLSWLRSGWIPGFMVNVFSFCCWKHSCAELSSKNPSIKRTFAEIEEIKVTLEKGVRRTKLSSLNFPFWKIYIQLAGCESHFRKYYADSVTAIVYMALKSWTKC